MGLDTRSYLETAAQDRILRSAVLIEFCQQAPQRPFVKAGVTLVCCFCYFFKAWHSGFFGKLLLRKIVIEPEIYPALCVRGMADRAGDGLEVQRRIRQPVLVQLDRILVAGKAAVLDAVAK